MRSHNFIAVDPVVFRRRLLNWYRRNRRELPWRKTADPYAVWVSEIMLQQTTVKAVIPYYERWMRLFPDIKSLAGAPLRKVLKAWQGLGYYQRARNLHAAARTIVRNHGGRIPDDAESLSRLPGFGAYTTAAVLSIVFGKTLPVLDGNVRRVLLRLICTGTDHPAPRDPVLRELLNAWISKKSPGAFNQAMMELGALVCRPRNPFCLLCPVRSFCGAERLGLQEVVPAPRTLKIEKLEAAVAVIIHRKRILLHRRPPGGLLGDLWEFPGGKIEPGESAEQATKREVREELGIEIEGLEFLARIRHAHTRFQVDLTAFVCRPAGALPAPAPDIAWVTPGALKRYPLPSGSVKIVNALLERRKPEIRL
ncbi:MAG: A/G-specific adenine glycosylase [Acidobacteriota bacterium]|nr:A/G-specific adenine glycosylase [Acidobacteriota bacterium]